MSYINKSSSQLLIGVFLSMIIAYFLPWENPNDIELKNFIYWGITGIFFFYGLKLNPRNLIKDVSNWRLHLLIQVITFAVFPLLILLFYPFFKESELYPIWLSVFFLSALPSTVSSSVIMTSIAKGNIPSAIFNATLTGLIGLIITPIWVGIFLSKGSSLELDTLGIIADLTKQILIPLLVGLVLSNYVRKVTNAIKPILSWYDKIIIFIIIYKSFSSAFLDDVFLQFSYDIILALVLILSLLFVIVFIITRFCASLLNFSIQDSITALFCATQKSLVHGSVFVIILVPNTAKQSLFLLAVMIYHSLQLIFTSYLAGRYSRQIDEI